MNPSRTLRLFEADPSVVVVESWSDPTLAQYGFAVTSDYVEVFWLTTLGPTATWLLRRLAAATSHCDPVHLDVAELATSLGIGSPVDRLTPLVKSLDRLVMFGVAQARRDRLAVRSHVPPLASKQIDRLPPHLRRSHENWMAGRASIDFPIVAASKISVGRSAA